LPGPKLIRFIGKILICFGYFDLRPARFGHFREVRAEDIIILVQAQHQDTAVGAQGQVIV